MEKTRRQIAREKATIGIYQNLLVDTSIEEIITFLEEDETLNDSQESMEFSCWLVETTVKNRESYQKLIEIHLKDSWSFDRLGTFEKAILMIGTCELLESELPRTIVINEAIINAKRFCDEDSYKFINGVLGQIA